MVSGRPLAKSPARPVVLQGRNCTQKCYFPDYRFSEDLDFTLAAEVPFETIRKELDVAFEKAYQDSGVLLRYARSDRQPHANSHTFYLSYEGPLGNLPSGKEVKTDITIKEKVVFPIEESPVLRAYTEYEDVPGNAIIKVYSLKEIAAEKVIAVCDRQGTSPAIFTTSGTYARTPTWTWRKLLTLSRASLSFADKALKKSARSSMQNRTGLEDCGTNDWPARWQRYLSLTAFFGLSEELSVRPESARTKSLLF